MFLIVFLICITFCYLIGYYLFGKQSYKIGTFCGYLGGIITAIGAFVNYFTGHYYEYTYVGVSLLNCWVFLNIASGMAEVRNRRGLFQYVFEKS